MKINYNKQAAHYEDTRDIDPHVYFTLTNLLKPVKGDVVLDFGCGTGNYLKQLTIDYDIVPYGIEPSDKMRKIAQKKLNKNCILNGDHTNIPCFATLFNIIYCTDVIHHIQQIDLLFQNLKKIAKSNTKLCICTESHYQLGEKYWIKYFPQILDIDSKRFHTIENIIEVGENNGWIHYETFRIEDEVVAPISSRFMECIRQKTLSVLHMISDQEYEQGLTVMEYDYEKQILLHQHEGYTFVLFRKDIQDEI